MHKTIVTARLGRVVWLAALTLALGGCQLPMPGDWRPGASEGRAPAPAAALPRAEPSGGAVPTTGEAEAACVAQGRSQGLEVQSVVGSRVQRGEDDVPLARDVMLRVARGGQVYDLRCNYQYASSEARIMSL
ncbi:MAG: hypothetical protein JJT95_01790 [Pararhodobacter sp.]|nr:hypothetical protein [Pararhodobacter sp.]